jgi:hypothetical protein
MGEPPRTPRRVPRRSSVGFRPEFTLFVLYLFGFFVVFALLIALPDLLAGARALPAGEGPLSAQEREQAARIARAAVEGKLGLALVAAVAALALGAWTGVLPGLRRKRR